MKLISLVLKWPLSIKNRFYDPGACSFPALAPRPGANLIWTGKGWIPWHFELKWPHPRYNSVRQRDYNLRPNVLEYLEEVPTNYYPLHFITQQTFHNEREFCCIRYLRILKYFGIVFRTAFLWVGTYLEPRLWNERSFLVQRIISKRVCCDFAFNNMTVMLYSWLQFDIF